MQYHYDMNGGSASAGSQDHTFMAEESLLPSSMAGKKQAREKGVARKGNAFVKEENSVICFAYLNITKDAITGVNQNLDAYYKRIYDYYQKHKPKGSVRSQISIQKRWGAIQKTVTRFCALKSKVDRKNESGKNEYDRVNSLLVSLLVYLMVYIS